MKKGTRRYNHIDLWCSALNECGVGVVRTQDDIDEALRVLSTTLNYRQIAKLIPYFNEATILKKLKRIGAPVIRLGRRNQRYSYLYNGAHHTIHELSQISKKPYHVLFTRLVRYNWPVSDAMSVPVAPRNYIGVAT